MIAMREVIDTTTLGWIKPELDETLRLARQEIEAFLEDPTDSARLRHAPAPGARHAAHDRARRARDGRDRDGEARVRTAVG
nr:hypothetical protein [Lysobacter terrigena]